MNLNNEIEISDTYLHFTMQLIIKITQSGFRLWFWPLTPGAFMSDKLRQLARGVFTARARRCENSAQLTQLTGMSALACYSAALSAGAHIPARCIPAYNTCISKHACSQHGGRLHCLVRHQGPQQSLSDVPAPKSSFSTIRFEAAKARYDALVQSSVFPSDTPTDSSSQVSRAFAILSTSSPVSSVKKSRACKPNYGNSLVVLRLWRIRRVWFWRPA